MTKEFTPFCKQKWGEKCPVTKDRLHRCRSYENHVTQHQCLCRKTLENK